MGTISCVIVTAIAVVFLICVYALACCWAIRCEAKRVKRQAYYDYFNDQAPVLESLPDPVTTEPEYHDHDPTWHTFLFVALLAAIIVLCAILSKILNQ